MKKWVIGGVLVLVAMGGFLYYSSEKIEPGSANSETSGWKTFVNTRDGYSVGYPTDGDAPAVTEIPSYLKSFGFEASLAFHAYGGGIGSIEIFNGSLDEAMAAERTIDENRIYTSTEDIVIDGKKGKVAHWTNKLDSTARISSSYFVEYGPGKTLLINGTKEFVSTIKFI